MQPSFDDMVMEMMAYIASVNGPESMAYSYLELRRVMEHEQNEQKQSDQADG